MYWVGAGPTATPGEDMSIWVPVGETDAEGGLEFEIPEDWLGPLPRLDQETDWLTVQVTAADCVRSKTYTLEVNDRFGVAPCEIELRPGGWTLYGQVRDARGRGIEALVRVELGPPNGHAIEAGIAVVTTQAGVLTDEEGHFELGKLPPGKYRSYVTANGHLSRMTWVAGVDRDVLEIDLDLGSGASVAGLIRAPDGTPRVGVAVWSQSDSELAPSRTTTDATN